MTLLLNDNKMFLHYKYISICFQVYNYQKHDLEFGILNIMNTNSVLMTHIPLVYHVKYVLRPVI